jgi:type II secretory pathway pseudopilin PulG
MNRRGFTLLEIFTAMLLLSALTALCLEFFAAGNGQRKEQYAQLVATQGAANVMERLAAVAWDDLPKQSGAKFSPSPQASKLLPEPRVEVQVGDLTGVPPARRVAATVFWRAQPGEPERKARVVAWRYKQP